MTEQRYRLPDVLGGGECARRVDLEDASWPNHRVVLVDGGWIVLIPEKALAEITPPLSAEPAIGQVVACGPDGSLRPLMERCDEGWFEVDDDRAAWTWEKVCERAQAHRGGPPVHLVPDPFAEPVELPWSATDVDGDRLRIEEEVPRNGQVLVEVQGRYDVSAVSLPSAAIRDAARALWAAADRAESGQSDG